jgi:hypothetical protein
MKLLWKERRLKLVQRELIKFQGRSDYEAEKEITTISGYIRLLFVEP